MKKISLVVISDKEDFKSEDEFLSEFFHNPEKFQVDLSIPKEEETKK